jgi:RNA polymerase sigma factor (TIGR02999 family)
MRRVARRGLSRARRFAFDPRELRVEPTPDNSEEPVAPGAASREITLAIRALQRGDPRASDELIELVYAELRQLARSRLAHEPGGGAGMTLDATALVHEAYLRVIGRSQQQAQAWDGRGHFFGAAALAMRRILVERARHQRRLKHGGGRAQVGLTDAAAQLELPQSEGTDLIALDEALARLEQFDPRKARVVSLRFFAGLSVEETAAAMDLSPATVKNEWAFARAWLHREMSGASAGAGAARDRADGSRR